MRSRSRVGVGIRTASKENNLLKSVAPIQAQRKRFREYFKACRKNGNAFVTYTPFDCFVDRLANGGHVEAGVESESKQERSSCD